MIFGIDYASVDGGHVEPAQTGAKFAYVRASGSLSTDPTWAHDRGRWAAAGIPAGAYHWFNFHADPVAQAHTFIAAAGERAPGELPPALDLEADSAAALHMTPLHCLAAAEACLEALIEHYGTVVVYTSARVWDDVFGDAASTLMPSCPLWLKVPYAWNARNAPHFESMPAAYALPRPWIGPMSAGTRMVQFQGDALGLPGTTSTVDLSEFIPQAGHTADSFSWFGNRLRSLGYTDTRAFQAAHGLVADGVIGPKTFAALTAQL